MSKSINITYETHNRLANLKKSDDDTFDNVISKLLDLEDKFDPRDDVIYEYEYIFEDDSRVFLVMFGDTIKIKYYSLKNNRFESNIKAWDSKFIIPREELDKFISFIVKESNLYVLYEMDDELILNGVHIKRVG